jgi:hypothetical protein
MTYNRVLLNVKKPNDVREGGHFWDFGVEPDLLESRWESGINIGMEDV